MDLARRSAGGFHDDSIQAHQLATVTGTQAQLVCTSLKRLTIWEFCVIMVFIMQLTCIVNSHPIVSGNDV
jgi:hypothetical protein